jgi:hypothetical protein
MVPINQFFSTKKANQAVSPTRPKAGNQLSTSQDANFHNYYESLDTETNDEKIGEANEEQEMEVYYKTSDTDIEEAKDCEHTRVYHVY